MIADRATRAKAGAVAAAAAIACIALGCAVHEPLAVDRAIEGAAFGAAPRAAQAFTELGLVGPLVEVAASLAVLAVFFARIRRRVAFSIGTLIAAHLLNDVFKGAFARARPDQWLVFRETSYAYPSGHAATAIAFYLLWAIFALRDRRLRPTSRVAVAVVLVFIALGILWSRLALGAHWPTDLLGGALLGVAVVAAGVALFGDPEREGWGTPRVAQK